MPHSGDSSPDQRDHHPEKHKPAAAAALLMPWEACCGGHVVPQVAAPLRDGRRGDPKRTDSPNTAELDSRPLEGSALANAAATMQPAGSAAAVSPAAATMQPAVSAVVPPAVVPHPLQDHRLHRPAPPCWVREGAWIRPCSFKRRVKCGADVCMRGIAGRERMSCDLNVRSYSGHPAASSPPPPTLAPPSRC